MTQISPDQMAAEALTLARQNWREIQSLRAHVDEHMEKMATLRGDLESTLCSMQFIRNKLQAVCEMVGDLQDQPASCIRARIKELEGGISEVKQVVQKLVGLVARG